MSEESTTPESRPEKRTKEEIIKGLDEEQTVTIRTTKPEKVATTDQE